MSCPLVAQGGVTFRCVVNAVGSDAATVLERDARVMRWLVASCFFFYLLLAHGHFKTSDEIGVYEATAAIWQNGNLVVGPGPHVFEGPDGRLYSHFSIGQSLLAMPFYVAGELASALLPRAVEEAIAGPMRPPRGRTGGNIRITAVSVYGAAASALLVGLFFRVQRELGASLRAALAAAASLGIGTYLVLHSAYFLRHTTVAITILGALYGFHRYRADGSLRTLALASAVASVTFVVRLPAGIAGPALGGYLAWILWERARAGDPAVRTGRALLAIAGPFLAACAIQLGTNHARWGVWFGSPMVDQIGSFTTPIWVGLRGLLLSSGSSIFLYSPPLLLLPWILPGLWQRQRALCTAALAVVLTFLLVSSTFWSWSGLWSSPGPRYLFVATPLLLLPVGLWLDAGRGRRRWIALGALTAVGAIVELGLILARWRTVVHVMDYRRWEPGMEFLFIPDQSPILAAWPVIADGGIDAWLWWLAEGWVQHPGQPLIAAILLVLGIAVVGHCLRKLYQAVTRSA